MNDTAPWVVHGTNPFDMTWVPQLKDIDQTNTNPQLMPANQKAATMLAEPEEEKVEQLLAFGMGRSDAVRYLKVS